MRSRVAIGILALLPATVALAERAPGICTRTADVLFLACHEQARQDQFVAGAVCLQERADERDACFEDAREERAEAREECREVRAARRDVCDLVGERRYDPAFDPDTFVDPREIGASVAPNPYFPLVPGATWTWEGGDEVITDAVTTDTKLVAGVRCVVVRDVVEVDGVIVEITDDWFAQDVDGNVWYCGESVRNFEVFAGDAPPTPELVDVDGSFKVGVDRARPGVIVPIDPVPGDAYRQEFALGNAEDVAEVLSVTGTETAPAASCTGTCLVTRELTPLEPDSDETKVYAPGVGLILEIDDEGNRVELVEFSIP
jgi:hypothetical protein